MTGPESNQRGGPAAGVGGESEVAEYFLSHLGPDLASFKLLGFKHPGRHFGSSSTLEATVGL